MIPAPVFFSTAEDSGFLQDFKNRIQNDSRVKNPDTFLNYPIVYIHYWPSQTINYVEKKTGLEKTLTKYDVYVGESIDLLGRTNQHHESGKKAGSEEDAWQYSLVNFKDNNEIPHIIVIGQEHFNKSFTLDVENRLIEYVASMQDTVRRSHNGRGNPQGDYYPSKEFDEVFSKIWSGLRRINRNLFVPETRIKDSAIFKASPLKKLKPEQIEAKELIISKVLDAYGSGKDGQLIFVQGEAGTGKTVLTTSTFYELIKRGEESPSDFPKMRCHLMVNHDEQAHVYEQMAKRLNLGEENVSRPTKFINKYSKDNKVDVAFIDEGHLLWTQKNQAYNSESANQLKDIIDRARVTVIMFDEYQVLTTQEYWEPEILEGFKQLSKSQDNFIQLSNQLRMDCSQSTMDWIYDFVLNRTVGQFIPDSKYDVRSFDSPEALHNAIRKLASKEDTKLTRLVATYDWEYSNKAIPADREFWDVRIGGWSMPWNYERERKMTLKQKRTIRSLAWAEQSQTIDEVGSTFTIQGFDLSYVGVILGPSVQYRDGQIVFCPENSKNDKATQNRTLSDGTKSKFGETLLRNEVKVLLTRGVKGLYIYACDPALRQALKDIAGI
jgi:hypothetical protein